MSDDISKGLERMLALEGMSDRERLYEALADAFRVGGAVWIPHIESCCVGCARSFMEAHPAYLYWTVGADEEAFDEDGTLRAPLRVQHAGAGAPVLYTFIGQYGLAMAWNGNLREDLEIVVPGAPEDEGNIE